MQIQSSETPTSQEGDQYEYNGKTLALQQQQLELQQ
jgi:hypothetical protein